MGGRRISWIEGQRIAERVIEHFWSKKLLERVEVAGSLRRYCKSSDRDIQVLGDIDLCVIPREGFNEELGAMFGWQKPRRKSDPLKAKKVGLIEGVQVDFYVTDREGWGAMMMFCTGSFPLNIIQRQKAKGLGFLLNEKGVWKGEQRIAGKTEQECYEALGLDWLESMERSL